MSRKPELENKYAIITASQALALELLTPFAKAKIFFGKGNNAVIYAENRKALINSRIKTTEVKIYKKLDNGEWKEEESAIVDG